MIVRHTAAEPAFVLDEAENFRGFAVDAAGVDLPTLDAALQGASVGKLGPTEGTDAAFISIDWVRAAAGELSSSEEWLSGFDNMIAYSKNKGWITEDGTQIISHIENAA
ncbi:MAG TPA: hypothetical protein VNT53_09740 [Pseudolysinimonas sp.]|nr:hypothetical protein [Pseudolysinimonas sp.]